MAKKYRNKFDVTKKFKITHIPPKDMEQAKGRINKAMKTKLPIEEIWSKTMNLRWSVLTTPMGIVITKTLQQESISNLDNSKWIDIEWNHSEWPDN